MRKRQYGFIRAPYFYFVFERAGSEMRFDVMCQTGPRTAIDVLPNFKVRSGAERVAYALNEAYSFGKGEGRRS